MQQKVNRTKKQQNEKKVNDNSYSLWEKKVYPITKAHSEKLQRAKIIRDLSFAFFGKLRYKDVIITSSLNNLQYALKVASMIHDRIENVALVISLNKIEYHLCEQNTQKKQLNNFSMFELKLTRFPTQKDKNQPGYHPGLTKEQIKNPLTGILKIHENRFYKEAQRGRDKLQNSKDRRQNFENKPKKTKYRKEKDQQNKNVAVHNYNPKHLNRKY